MKNFIFFVCSLVCLSFVNAQEAQPKGGAVIAIATATQPVTTATSNKVKLQLPECIYAVPGKEVSVYFDNIVLVINPDIYVFDVTCATGRNDHRR
ncbi:MAG: hypothetical protein IJT83_16405, partial [Victivallales bacterium]|nr:hypothetical protein [Victivallales bacterium]